MRLASSKLGPVEGDEDAPPSIPSPVPVELSRLMDLLAAASEVVSDENIVKLAWSCLRPGESCEAFSRLEIATASGERLS